MTGLMQGTSKLSRIKAGASTVGRVACCIAGNLMYVVALLAGIVLVGGLVIAILQLDKETLPEPKSEISELLSAFQLEFPAQMVWQRGIYNQHSLASALRNMSVHGIEAHVAYFKGHIMMGQEPNEESDLSFHEFLEKVQAGPKAIKLRYRHMATLQPTLRHLALQREFKLLAAPVFLHADIAVGPGGTHGPFTSRQAAEDFIQACRGIYPHAILSVGWNVDCDVALANPPPAPEVAIPTHRKQGRGHGKHEVALHKPLPRPPPMYTTQMLSDLVLLIEDGNWEGAVTLNVDLCLLPQSYRTVLKDFLAQQERRWTLTVTNRPHRAVQDFEMRWLEAYVSRSSYFFDVLDPENGKAIPLIL
eukprot:jgi/Mesvir1/5838/Mv00632-RA.1